MVAGPGEAKLGRTTLLVAVRGWTTSGDPLLLGHRGGELGPDFVDALSAGLHDTEVWAPNLDLSMFCMRSAESLSRELFDKIERKLESMPAIRRIILLGYSSGSVLVRRVFCMAHGARADGTIGDRKASWADMIDRVVMLSSITRGWEQSSAAPAHVRFIAPILEFIANTVGWLKRLAGSAEADKPFIQQLRRGAPFVVATRIQYVKVFEALRARCDLPPNSILRAAGLPSTIFLLGAKDEYVSPADCTELGPRIEFVFIELPSSNHTDAILIAGSETAATERRERLVAAIADDFDALKKSTWAVRASDIDDYLDPMDVMPKDADSGSPAVDHAVMIVHGIRDNGFWTKRVAREIKTLARQSGTAVRAPTPSYGYFSMWDFIRFGGRDQATYWFMERYADVVTHAPTARISFVGHSNGTYVAARALQLCQAIRFEHVVFAGSVVRRDFPWSCYGGRVRSVLNYVGSGDGVVACLPAVLELLKLRWLDVGGAGAFGFAEAQKASTTAAPFEHEPANVPKLNEFRFVPGGHGAAIGEQFWPEIARFALYGTPPNRKPVSRNVLIELLYRCAPFPMAILGAVALATLVLPLIAVAYAVDAGYALVWVLATLVLSIVVSWVAGRFLRQW